MKKVDLTLPEFLFILGTRAFLAAGVGLLVADRFFLLLLAFLPSGVPFHGPRNHQPRGPV